MEKLKKAVEVFNINIAELFAQYETSQDGNMDINEFKELIVVMEPNIRTTDVLAAFALLDTDKNFTVNL